MCIFDYDLVVLIQKMLMLGISIGLAFYFIFVNCLVRVLSAHPIGLEEDLTLLTNQVVKLLDCHQN